MDKRLVVWLDRADLYKWLKERSIRAENLEQTANLSMVYGNRMTFKNEGELELFKAKWNVRVH